MANLPNTISRRAALTGTAAATAALATLPALASDGDAELFALEPAFNAAMERFQVAMDVRAEAEDRYSEVRPPMPEEQKMPKDVLDAWEGLTVRQISLLPDWHPINVWFTEGTDARKAWRDECDRLCVDTGLKAAEDAEYACMTEVDDVMREILAIPARTPAGLLLKLRVADAADCEPHDLMPAITADIEAMAGGQQVAS